MFRKKELTVLLLSTSLVFAACDMEDEQPTEEETTEETENGSESNEGEQEEASDEESEEDVSEADSPEEIDDFWVAQEPVDQEELGYDIYDYDEYIDQAEEMEAETITAWEEGDYTLEEPLVVENPYEISPLSALVLFETDELSTVTIHVEGQTEETTLSNTFEEENTLHQIPVLGLYPDEENSVVVEVEENGNVSEHDLTISTDPLPEPFFDIELVTEGQQEEMEEGLTFFMPAAGELFALDSDGDVRFYLTTWMTNNFELLDNGNFVTALRREHDGDAYSSPFDHLVELDFLGRPYHSYIFDQHNFDGIDLFHHDIIELPNENWLALVHDGSGNYVEDEMAEINNETGEVMSQMNFKDVFPDTYYEDYTGPGEDIGDWWHQNSVWLTSDGRSVLISGRNQDMTLKMDYPTLEIEWILTADENWPSEEERSDDYLLDPINDVKFPMGQHAVEEMPDQDGDSDTMDIILFDNNRYITRGHEELHEDYSRAVQYRINEEEMTVEEIWSYGEERGEDYYSFIVGDADYLPEQNNALITSGYVELEDEPVSMVTEVSREDNEELYEAHISGIVPEEHGRSAIYRAERIPLYQEDFTVDLDIE